MRISRLYLLLFVLCAGLSAELVRAEETTIAVAANFLNASRALASAFETATSHQVAIVSGSTGLLYAQIINGAPVDLLLAADQERPRLLSENGLGDPASVVTYATGRLALWSGHEGRIGENALANLIKDEFRWFAIAEPEVAPYGTAARQALENLGVWQSIAPRMVKGQNVAQTFAMIETGNAELGLVALSQVLAYEGPASYQIVSAGLYDPIRQDVVLLKRAVENSAALEFLAFLKTPAALVIMASYGYSAPDQTVESPAQAIQ